MTKPSCLPEKSFSFLLSSPHLQVLSQMVVSELALWFDFHGPSQVFFLRLQCLYSRTPESRHNTSTAESYRATIPSAYDTAPQPLSAFSESTTHLPGMPSTNRH